jgi:hypothetical protein
MTGTRGNRGKGVGGRTRSIFTECGRCIKGNPDRIQHHLNLHYKVCKECKENGCQSFNIKNLTFNTDNFIHDMKGKGRPQLNDYFKGATSSAVARDDDGNQVITTGIPAEFCKGMRPSEIHLIEAHERQDIFMDVADYVLKGGGEAVLTQTSKQRRKARQKKRKKEKMKQQQ